MTEWTHDVSLLIPSAGTAQILLLPEGDRWALPHCQIHALYSNLYELSRQIKASLGADMTMMRIVAQQVDGDAKTKQTAMLMENHTSHWLVPDGAQWVDCTALDTLTLVEEWIRPTLIRVLETLLDPPPPQRPPWFQPGWFAGAAAWIVATLRTHGYTLLGEPEQYKHGILSSVLRTETTAGDIYFKVAVDLPLFGDEPRLSEALGRMFPQDIPAPLAIDEARRWMLTADFGSELRQIKPSAGVLKDVVQKYARLQIDTAAHLDVLFGVGCLDRRLDVLSGQIDSLLADEAAYAQLNDDERARWQASSPQLKALCRRLMDYPVPYTLVHGDFHAGNIAILDEHIVYFDWTDACVAHPFFDVAVLVELDVKEHETIVRDAYLDEWRSYAPIEQLREAYELAKTLSALHQAVSYQGIVNGVESDQRADMDWGVPRFAREILRALNTADA